MKWGAHGIHSATKLMDGQGRVLGSITVGDPELIQKSICFLDLQGPSLSPFNAWVLSKV
jgi:O-succinylhomoserine sulfhydrylase